MRFVKARVAASELKIHMAKSFTSGGYCNISTSLTVLFTAYSHNENGTATLCSQFSRANLSRQYGEWWGTRVPWVEPPFALPLWSQVDRLLNMSSPDSFPLEELYPMAPQMHESLVESFSQNLSAFNRSKFRNATNGTSSQTTAPSISPTSAPSLASSVVMKSIVLPPCWISSNQNLSGVECYGFFDLSFPRKFWDSRNENGFLPEGKEKQAVQQWLWRAQAFLKVEQTHIESINVIKFLLGPKGNIHPGSGGSDGSKCGTVR
jgi:hypothetical protein